MLCSLVTLPLQQWLIRTECSFADSESKGGQIETLLRDKGSLCGCKCYLVLKHSSEIYYDIVLNNVNINSFWQLTQDEYESVPT